MKSSASGRLLITGALLGALLTFPAAAQDPKTATTAPSATGTNSDAAKPAVAASAAPTSGIADVLKMLDAGVSKDVVKAYVENSPTGYTLSAADVVALKERGVNDDITMLLLKRGADARAQAAQVAATPAPQPAAVDSTADSSKRVVRYQNSANLNPESEEYFQHYYLYPRTLAYTYQTLGVQPYAYYGYYPSMSFGPGYGYGYGPVRRGFRRY